VIGRTSLWRNRDYLLLWGGQVVSVLGSRVSQISLPLLIIAVTHSPAQAGTVAALFGLPYLLFGLLAGVLVDSWDRKRTMIICSAINCVGTGTIPLAIVSGRLSMPQLYAVALVTGSAFVFFDVAEIAALPNVVAPGQLPAAVGQNQATFSAGGVAGQPIYNVATITYRLRSVPDELQGRVNSAARVLALGAVPVGAAVGGVVLQAAGTTAMVWVLTGGTGLLALAATLTRSIRAAPRITLRQS
jgi:MFS family permease